MTGRPISLTRAQVALAAYRHPQETRSDVELVVALLGDLMHLADALRTHDDPDAPLGPLWPQDPAGTRHGLLAAQLAGENYHFEVIGDGDFPVDERGYQLAAAPLDVMKLADDFRRHEIVWRLRYPQRTDDLVSGADRRLCAALRVDRDEALTLLGRQIVTILLDPDEVL